MCGGGRRHVRSLVRWAPCRVLATAAAGSKGRISPAAHWLFYKQSKYGSDVLKTAFKPKWIAALLGALIVATGFVLLSGWQFGSSTTEPPVKAEKTEVPVPLTEHVQPGTELLGTKADQIVTMQGHFLPDTEILVEKRVHEGQTGYWVISAFAVDGAPDGEAIAVVRGWEAEPNDPPATPEGQFTITGRLIPPEGPVLQRDVREPYYAAVSSAQLANTWDLPLYSGFVSIHELANDAGPVTEPGLSHIFVGTQPQEATVNWLNVFYGIEWVVFAGFAFFLWYRLVRDDYQRELDELAEQGAAEHRRGQEPTGQDAGQEPSQDHPSSGPHGTSQNH